MPTQVAFLNIRWLKIPFSYPVVSERLPNEMKPEMVVSSLSQMHTSLNHCRLNQRAFVKRKKRIQVFASRQTIKVLKKTTAKCLVEFLREMSVKVWNINSCRHIFINSRSRSVSFISFLAFFLRWLVAFLCLLLATKCMITLLLRQIKESTNFMTQSKWPSIKTRNQTIVNQIRLLSKVSTAEIFGGQWCQVRGMRNILKNFVGACRGSDDHYLQVDCENKRKADKKLLCFIATSLWNWKRKRREDRRSG